LGFLEAADVLVGDAEGGFDWSDEAHTRFLLRATGDDNPFVTVLEFLADAEVRRYAPNGYTEPPPKKAVAGEDDEDDAAASQDLVFSEWFPDSESDPMKLRMKLPIRLEQHGYSIDLGHWADGSRRNDFKLYAGNRSAHSIACAMLHGTRKKPSKKQSVGEVKTLGIASLWNQQRDDLSAKPFDVLTLMGGSFNFDPRGAWTALDAGYSPDEQKHGVAGSPVVEILAAWGLEHARPDEDEKTRQVHYAAWSGFVAPILARPALAGASVGVPIRTFRFMFGGTKHNKVVTFAQEEVNT
jgi:CRISPR-associated protein Csx14